MNLGTSVANFLVRSLLKPLCHAAPPIVSGPIARRLLPLLPKISSREYTIRSLTGALYAHRTGDIVGDRMWIIGHFDWRVLALAAQYAPVGARIIEIGANNGSETVGLAMIVGKTGHILAFEPEPTVAAVLNHNVELNGFEHVTVQAVAVSDSSGVVKFVSPVADNSGIGHIATSPAADVSTFEVPSITIDSLPLEFGAATVITIDVEGHEVSVLLGGKAYIRRHRPVIIVEAVPRHLLRAGQSVQALLDLLHAFEYEVFEIGTFGIKPISQRAWPEAYEKNWFCTPSETRTDRSSISRLFIRNLLTPNILHLHPLDKSRAYLRM